MMDIPLENCIVGVYPRSRLMIEGKVAAESFIRKYEPQETIDLVNRLKRYKKTYIYMPTWRNDGTDFIKNAGFQWEQLNEVMKEKEDLFILKLHPFTRLDVSMLSKYSNICFYPAASDIYTVLPFIDCLITDYSSIYTDFLTMDKEIILFVFDYDEYVRNSYDLYEYDKYFIGSRANNFEELLRLIKTDKDCHVPKEKRDYLIDFYWENNARDIDLVEEVKKRLRGLKENID